MNKRLSRRTVLRGLGATIALPHLEVMSPRSAKAAEGATIPPRMVVAHYGTGTNVFEFFPKDTGKDFTFSRILKPLERFREQMTVMSGLYLEHGGGHSGDYTFLTGTEGMKSDGIDGGISADQVVAEQMANETRFPSLQMSIARGSGYGNQGLATVSWNRNGIPLAAENDPKVIFSRLFKVDKKHEAKIRDERFRRHGSILDFVQGEAKRLERQVSHADKAKLDEYFTSVREIELQLDRNVAWADKPKPSPRLEGVGDYSRSFAPGVRGFSYEKWKQLMFDLIVMALQTDSTRVITFNIRTEGTGERWPVHGVSKGHHALSHANGPNDMEELAKVDEINMGFWVKFLDRMQSVKEVDGNSLLDHSMIAYSSGAGFAHSRDKLPTCLFGGKALGIQHQGHLKLPDSTPLARVWHTMVDRMGVPVGETFQDSTGVISEMI